MIKVLHIHTLSVISGSGLNVLDTVKRLKEKGYKVEFASSPEGGSLIDEVASFGITVRPLRYLGREVNILKDPLALFELMLLIRRQRYDIVHTHNSKAGFIGRIAARIAGVPVVIHTIHGFSFHEYERPPFRILYVLLERLAAKFSDALITVSTPLKEWGLRLGIGKDAQYRVIPDGIDIERFKVNTDSGIKRSELGIAADDLAVGLVAKLWDGKGHHTLIKAMPDIIKEVPRVKFIFVGEGYLRRNLENQVTTLGLKDSVLFTGFRKDIPEITSIFDLAVLPSFFEGLGRSLLEAMVLSKPVVATNVGGIPEVVKDNLNGFLVPPGDARALAEAIIHLLKNKELRRRMGEEGRKQIDERFSTKKMVDNIEGVYRQILKEKGF
jgi:glycosyltransferase involved in cell wall biosynthesis